MSNCTVNYAKAWLMGVDPVATGHQIKKHRQAAYLSQEDLSDCFERGGDPVSRISISGWETGKKLPSLSHLVFLTELFDCALDELVMSYRRSREADDRDQPVPLLTEYGSDPDEYLHTQMLVFFCKFTVCIH